jgi:formate dehydrogenase major subunit
MSTNRRLRDWLTAWPVYRQLSTGDRTARGTATQSPRSRALRPRIATADTRARSVYPYCAVGCGQLVYAAEGRVLQIEGDPDSPVSRGRLCPKGSASLQAWPSRRRR